MRDLVHNLGISTALASQTVTSSAVNGNILDLLGFEGVAIAICSGTITDGSYAVTLTEGDASDLSDGASVAAANILGTLPSFAATDDNVTKKAGYIGIRRYIRVTLTPTGATSGGSFSGVVIKGHAADRPVA